MRFTLSDIQKTRLPYKVIGGDKDAGEVVGSGKGNKAKTSTGNALKSEPLGIQHIKQVLKGKGISFETEYKFLTFRRFRFDIAILSYRIAIEYEGMVKTGERGGHQMIHHYTKNCTKYNLAAIDGWTMLRYTGLNYKEFEQNLVDFLMNVK